MPERLQRRLLWGSDIAPLKFKAPGQLLLKFKAPGQLLLYVGLSDSQSLDSMLNQMAPALGGHILAFEMRREPDHDILNGQLYDQLRTHAWQGDLQGVGGGPNCRTWSILRWFPKPGEQSDTDNDSLLLLRLMLLAHLINLRFKGPVLP